jgi:predicted transcriptional regulator
MSPTNLKERRAKLQISQFALAGMANVSRFNIQLFEQGHRELTAQEQQRIERALNVTNNRHKSK